MYIHFNEKVNKVSNLYDKRDYHNFPIVNFPFYVATFYSRRIFLINGTNKKSTELGLLVVKLNPSLPKFHGRHHDLVICYVIFVSQMTTEMFGLSLSQFKTIFLFHN